MTIADVSSLLFCGGGGSKVTTPQSSDDDYHSPPSQQLTRLTKGNAYSLGLKKASKLMPGGKVWMHFLMVVVLLGGVTTKVDASSSTSTSTSASPKKNILITTGDEAEVVELPVVLQSVKSFAQSMKLGDPASLEESQKTINTLEELSKKYMSSEDNILGLSKFDGSSESLKHDLDQIHELILSMSVLEDVFSQDSFLIDSAPMDTFVASFKDVAPILANIKSALSDIVDIVKETTGVESSFKDKDTKSIIDVAATRNLMMEQEDDMSNSNYTYSSSPISKTEFEFRARGYDGFMAEDQSRDTVLHSNTFKGDFEFLHEDFATFMGSNSYDNGAGRRLNDEGACVVPNENDLKSTRCARLLSCAKEYTLYDLFIYFFGDNIEEAKGIVKEDENVTFFDEKDILQKYNTIQELVLYGDCDGVLQQFHRYQESTEVWKAGSVTSICRGWGTTRKGSLKGVYDFLRFRFTKEVEDKETKEMVWKEDFPQSLKKHSVGTGYSFDFKIEAGTGSELFKPMFVFHDAVVDNVDEPGRVEAGIMKKDVEGRYVNIYCSDEYGQGSFNIANSICVDLNTFYFEDWGSWQRYQNDGELIVYADNAVSITIYDFQAFKIVGQMYDKLIGCATRIRDNLKAKQGWYKGLDVDLTKPWKGLDMENCLTDHGKLDFYYCSEYEQLVRFKDHEGNDLIVESFNEYFHSSNTRGSDSFYVENYIEVVDSMSNTLFGKKTTIGQVCSYADAMEDDVVQDLPGYCCLDSPDTTKWWGEQYSCSYEYGDDKGKAKPRSMCQNPGPWWASFNEDACNSYSGKWCPNPRPCEALQCVKEAKNKVKDDLKSRPFFEYLDEAPDLKYENDDYENEKKCGDLREYLQYDRDFSDDERICEELEHIQCRNDFTNLDEAISNEGGEEELAVDTKLLVRKEDFFDVDAAKNWRRANKSVEVLAEGLKVKLDVYKITSKDSCLTAVSAIAGTAAPCVITMKLVHSVFWFAHHFANIAAKLSSAIYGAVVEKPDFYADREIQVINFENLITTANNGITTFKAVQQVKQLLGDIADDLTALVEEDEEGRRLAENTCDHLPKDEVKCGNANDESAPCQCNDHRYNCECKLNYSFIKLQSTAGCDGVDSDNDNFIDICEDRFPPRLVFTKPETFMCDLSDPDKLCFDSETFLNEVDAKKFIRSQVHVNDDCATQSQLGYDLSKVEDSKCSSTVFRMNPKQNYPECKGREVLDREGNKNPFTNPLYGEESFITVKVDNEDPVVKCGFTDNLPSSNKSRPLVEVDDKTLFHYTDDKNDDSNLESGFFYEIKDNCEDRNVDVEINISSNERNYVNDPGMNLAPYQYEGYAEQVHALYMPTTCGLGGKYGSKCFQDKTIEEPIRFYEIKVTATDSAGRTDMDICHIIVAPRCSKEKKYDPLYCEDKYKYTHDYLKTLVSQSKVRYPLASEKLTWDFKLIPKFTFDVTGLDLGGDDDNGIFARAQSTNTIDGAEISIFTIASILAVLALVDVGRRWRNRKVVEKKEGNGVVSDHESTSIDE